MKHENCTLQISLLAGKMTVNCAFLYVADGGETNTRLCIYSAQLYSVCQPLMSVRMRESK